MSPGVPACARTRHSEGHLRVGGASGPRIQDAPPGRPHVKEFRDSSFAATSSSSPSRRPRRRLRRAHYVLRRQPADADRGDDLRQARLSRSHVHHQRLGLPLRRVPYGCHLVSRRRSRRLLLRREAHGTCCASGGPAARRTKACLTRSGATRSSSPRSAKAAPRARG